MVSEEKDVEPIIPLGKMVSVLKCSLDWSGDAGLRIWHPSRGWLPVKDRGGCPHVPKELAMKLINEIEEKSKQEDDDRTSEVKKAEGGTRGEEEKWLQDFVDCHPVLRELPEKLKKRLVVPIEEKIGKIPGVNKRDRKRWYQKGVTVHLYSGEPGGFNLEAAVKEKGGDLRRLLEVDVKKGKEFDMVEDPMYSSLLRMAMDDVVEAVVCGPNCRTRSVLRHIPIPGQPDAPRPVRRWGGEEWGNWDNTSEERRKVEEDDVMLWRARSQLIIGGLFNHIYQRCSSWWSNQVLLRTILRWCRSGGLRSGRSFVKCMVGERFISTRAIGVERLRNQPQLVEAWS